MMDQWGGDERRRYPRLKGATVEYTVVDKAHLREMSFTEDISAVGIRMLASEELKLDMLLNLKIYLPNFPEAIAATGKVVWTRRSSFLRKEGAQGEHFDIGIEFVDIDDQDQTTICQYTLDQTIGD